MKAHRSQALVLVFVVLGACLGALSRADAGPFDNNPKILIHVAPTAWPSGCRSGVLSDCQDATVQANLSTGGPTYFAYLLAARGSLPDVAGLQCGINYQNGQSNARHDGKGIDIFEWKSCADNQIITAGVNSWPDPGTGILITWDRTTHCQSDGVTVAGYFYLAAYSADKLQVTRRPVDSKARLATCSAGEVTVAGSSLGFAAFSAGASTAGCNPCNGNCPDPPTPPPPVAPVIPPASPDNADPRVLLHIAAPSLGGQCALTDPSTAVVSAGLSTKDLGPFYFAYLLVARHNLTGVAGVGCGISYENNQPGDMANGSGIDMFSWTLCATAEWYSGVGPSRWPQPGSGNMIVWDTSVACQTGATAVAGYFYLGAYSPDRLSVSPDPRYDSVIVCDCTAKEFVVGGAGLGFVEFSAQAATSGCNSWLKNCVSKVPVALTTWGAVKALYRR